MNGREPVINQLMEFNGYMGKSSCRLEVYSNHQRTIVVLTNEFTDKHKDVGTSITNAAEVVQWAATNICREKGIPTKDVVYVESYIWESEPRYYDQVQFDVDCDRFLSRKEAIILNKTRYLNDIAFSVTVMESPLSQPQWSRIGGDDEFQAFLNEYLG